MQNIKFGTLNANGTVTETATLSKTSIEGCPHFIFAPEHYNTDGTCKCKDKANSVMKKWGYKWDNKVKQWN